MGYTCAFTHCSNSTYTLEAWKKKPCDIHKCLHYHDACTCFPPFQLFSFPPGKKHASIRNEWAKATQRCEKVQLGNSGKRKSVNWVPVKNSRMCSIHFKNGIDKQNVDGNWIYNNPTLDLGEAGTYYTPKQRRKPPACRQTAVYSSTKETRNENDSIAIASLPSQSHILAEHSYQHLCLCHCHNLQSECPECGKQPSVAVQKQPEVAVKYVSSIDDCMAPKRVEDEPSLQQDIIHDLNTVTRRRRIGTMKYTRTDAKVRTYTGLASKSQFDDLLRHLTPKASNMRYWEGQQKTQPLRRNFKKTPKKSGPKRKLSIREELLITLMKLRLGLINEVLGDMFGVGTSTISAVFNTWIKFLANELAPLIYWPDKESVLSTFPKSLSSKYRKVRCTIDCTEVFTERPRSLELQAVTWSDYKKHNTVKFLVAISPNGMVCFLSKAWVGRASDRRITMESGFMDKIEFGDQVLADRGFPIVEDLAVRGATLHIPPPGSGLEQMSRSEVLKTKDVANARIHVERSIGRMKEYSILSQTLPINLIPLIDDIATVCAALSNLKEPLVV